MWKLYLDDIRNPKTQGFTIARTFEKAVELIQEKGMPNDISFDHDLGEDGNKKELKSGYDLAKWIVESDIDKIINIPDDFSYNVHSANPVGARNIDGLLKNYLEYKKES